MHRGKLCSSLCITQSEILKLLGPRGRRRAALGIRSVECADVLEHIVLAYIRVRMPTPNGLHQRITGTQRSMEADPLRRSTDRLSIHFLLAFVLPTLQAKT
jgi:hypothetical protein